ncbi:hypothetical protein C900_05333 [Fulvivirga imtechensis AK7]|uniref:Uncharacterized protein n=1 Tax=Fulvivirga imtechensis AK7 TaxID=1237149 RepID=L8JPI0_9BACT|nr:hypothetical protein C900_05333 [Fulvivirga imtechensis AK7]
MAAVVRKNDSTMGNFYRVLISTITISKPFLYSFSATYKGGIDF